MQRSLLNLQRLPIVINTVRAERGDLLVLLPSLLPIAHARNQRATIATNSRAGDVSAVRWPHYFNDHQPARLVSRARAGAF